MPDHWVEERVAAGNSVLAHLGDSGPTIQGQQSGGRVVFNPADDDGDEQKVLNIFYFNCLMHDFFYLLGFREADGNFQRDNLGRGGAPATAWTPAPTRAPSGAPPTCPHQ